MADGDSDEQVRPLCAYATHRPHAISSTHKFYDVQALYERDEVSKLEREAVQSALLLLVEYTNKMAALDCMVVTNANRSSTGRTTWNSRRCQQGG